jgi:hypothetical protein
MIAMGRCAVLQPPEPPSGFRSFRCSYENPGLCELHDCTPYSITCQPRSHKLTRSDSERCLRLSARVQEEAQPGVLSELRDPFRNPQHECPPRILRLSHRFARLSQKPEVRAKIRRRNSHASGRASGHTKYAVLYGVRSTLRSILRGSIANDHPQFQPSSPSLHALCCIVRASRLWRIQKSSWVVG